MLYSGKLFLIPCYNLKVFTSSEIIAVENHPPEENQQPRPTEPSLPTNNNSVDDKDQTIPVTPTPHLPDNNNSESLQLNIYYQDHRKHNYIIKKELGRGGIGITYLATYQPDTSEECLVVLKTLKDELRSRLDFTDIDRSFVDEALQLQKCQGKYIVTIRDFVWINNKQFIVMEYIEGDNLRQLIQKTGKPLRIPEAIKYIQQIGQALQRIHDQGSLHRDVKPENIIIRTSPKEAVLIDFGLASEFEPDTIRENRYGVTPGYGPPEQHDQEVKWGKYSDIYSLAATLYFLLTGNDPIPANQRLLHRLTPPNKINPRISGKLSAAILEKGMNLDPYSRPQTVGEWLELLNNSDNLHPRDNQSSRGKIILAIASLLLIIPSLWLLSRLGDRLCNSSNPNDTFFFCPPPEIVWNKYQSQEYQFSLEYPPNWYVKEKPGDAIRNWQLHLFEEANLNQPVATIEVETDLNPSTSTSDYLNNKIIPQIKNKQSLKQSNFDINLQDSQKHPGVKLEYEYQDLQTNSLINLSEIVTVYRQKGYNITNLNSDRPETTKVIDQIFVTFTFF